jgi:lipoprotein-anchoring transpeptidase ErfK/SrfK
MFVSRRSVVMGAVSLAGGVLARSAMAQEAAADYRQIYGPIEGEPFPVPAINLSRIHPGYLRTTVAYDTDQPAGTIVIDPSQRYLFLVDGNGGALRYGVGVGREGFAWSGTAQIKAKREWPDWYPPKEMLARDPSIMQVMSKLQSGIGMPGGPGNPLGARAMYLFQGNKDTLYRIHGTLEPWTIGTRVSSGCIRMINQDAIDLFSRVPVGTKVVVLGSAGVRSRPEPEAEAQPVAPMQQPPDQNGYDPYDPYGFDRRGGPMQNDDDN